MNSPKWVNNARTIFDGLVTVLSVVLPLLKSLKKKVRKDPSLTGTESDDSVSR